MGRRSGVCEREKEGGKRTFGISSSTPPPSGHFHPHPHPFAQICIGDTKLARSVKTEVRGPSRLLSPSGPSGRGPGLVPPLACNARVFFRHTLHFPLLLALSSRSVPHPRLSLSLFHLSSLPYPLSHLFSPCFLSFPLLHFSTSSLSPPTCIAIV